MKRFDSVESYVAAGGPWIESLLLLREILVSSGLDETVKWGMPVYTLNNKNVAGFSAFKSWTGIWFYQGVFLKDSAGVLINAQEGTTKGLRQWRFRSVDEIRKHRSTLSAYLEEHLGVKEITTRGYEQAVVEDIVRRIRINEHKRKQAPLGLKVTSKAFGYGRRYPIVHGFME